MRRILAGVENSDTQFHSPASLSPENSDEPSGITRAARAPPSPSASGEFLNNDEDLIGRRPRGPSFTVGVIGQPPERSTVNFPTQDILNQTTSRSQSLSSISSSTEYSYQFLSSQPNISQTAGEQSTRPKGAVTADTPAVGIQQAAHAQTQARRKRGRPRKEPVTVPEESKRETKNRTKTGCITCRKRKKKCTEERPICNSCQKNNYACIYPETELYRTGKEKANEDARRASLPVPRPLPSLFEGIESPLDRHLLHHFIHNCSPVLSLNKGGRNLYLVHVLPMAATHGPLMHGILALSASHLSNTVEGRQLAQEEGLVDHQYTLHSFLIRGIREQLMEQQSTIQDQTIAMNLLAILYTVAEGQTNGEYNQHLAAAKTMLGLLKSDSEEFCDFVFENIQYYVTISTLLSTKTQHYLPLEKPTGMSKDPNVQIVGFQCDLLGMFSRVCQLRSRVRGLVKEKGDFNLDTSMYSEAADIDIELHQWVSPFEEASDRWIATQVCQRATWAYLRRTMTFPRPGEEMHPVIEDALSLFENLSLQDSSNCCLLSPLFLLGCCAFESFHRVSILNAYDRLHQYSGLRNVQVTKDFTETLWEKMDSETYDSWDWEAIAERSNLDFLMA